MIISWYGEGCFKIQSGELVVLTDPFDNKTGLTPPRLKTDIILKTLTPLPMKDSVPENLPADYIINGPGEYNIREVTVKGLPLLNESTENFLKTIYIMEAEKINLCFLGHISEMPDSNIMEQLADIDVLFVPAGRVKNSPFISKEVSATLVKNLEPKIVVPSFFQIPGLKREAADIKEFLEEFNGKKNNDKTTEEKLTLKKKDLDEIKSTQIMVLKI